MMKRLIIMTLILIGVCASFEVQAKGSATPPKKLRRAVVMTAGVPTLQPKTVEFIDAMVRIKQGLQYQVNSDVLFSLQPQKSNFGFKMQF